MSLSPPKWIAPRRHALVVEDSLLHQRLATGLLSRRGFHTTIVNNGQEAVVAARDYRFNLILMDIEMPVLDGYATTLRIRDQESKGGRHVPIVAVTSHADPDRALNAGMDAYLAKPLSASALDAVLRAFVECRNVRCRTFRRLSWQYQAANIEPPTSIVI